MHLNKDLLSIIFSFINKRQDYLSIFLTSKEWNTLGYKYLDLVIDNQWAIKYV